MYRTDVYFLSKMLAELPFHVIYPFAFVAVSYHMVGFTDDVINFFICAGIVVLVANCAISFGKRSEEEVERRRDSRRGKKDMGLEESQDTMAFMLQYLLGL